MLFVLAFSLALSAPAGAASRSLERVALWPGPSHTRVVLNVTGPVKPKVTRLKRPDRVVVDLRGTTLATRIPQPAENDHQVKRVRTGKHPKNLLRVVFDLKRSVTVSVSDRSPARGKGHQIVLELQALDGPKPVQAASAARALRDVVVVLDPGHGGVDPGAIGRKYRTYEAAVMLDLASAVKRELLKHRGLSVVLTRNKDKSVKLGQRRRIARKAQADLFVSLHADSFRDPKVSGASVYVLSENGASSEAAKWIADRANRSDLVGGVSVKHPDRQVAEVLLDLSMHAKLGASADAAGRIVGELSKVSVMHKHEVQRARFHVLKAPDIPSLLVETAFISNPREEKRLRSKKHRAQLAKAIARGIVRYFDVNPPAGTLLAARRHVITSGETLSHIAVRYDVSIRSLRRENHLGSDMLQVGQTLLIPNRESDG
ncbi:MAG: N-acetylmuramoyl-L-alanine amidase [Gammaproteobacteria bacterium]|nr:N-acetylmuramoyl-L-alanine amidase [Gammaproteobacteria bacterium]